MSKPNRKTLHWFEYAGIAIAFFGNTAKLTF